MSRLDADHCERVARSIVAQTRRIIVDALATAREVVRKGDGSFVTDIDLAVEQRVRDLLAEHCPDHAILGEEGGGASDDGRPRWIIDPIDGTHSLRNGIPLYGTLLALRHEGRSVIGVIDLPGLDRTYFAREGAGAWCGDRRLSVAAAAGGMPAALDGEIIGIAERRQFARSGQVDRFDRLIGAYDSVRTYCDCFGHAMVAEGALAAMLDVDLALWDRAATEIIVREAGGVFRTLPGRPEGSVAGPDAERRDVVFGREDVVDWIESVIRSHPPR